MKGFWISQSNLLAALFVCCVYLQNLSSCWSLNDEGVALRRFKENLLSDPYGALSHWIDEIGVESQYSWSGVVGSDGYIVALNSRRTRKMTHRKLLQQSPSPSPAPFSSLAPFFSPAPSPSPATFSSPAPTPATFLSPSPTTHISPPTLPNTPPSSPNDNHNTNHHHHNNNHRRLILTQAIGGPLLLVIVLAGILYYKGGKVTTVKPWATGLSGQLQKAFVTGVPSLKRSELEGACEDFSNVIGSSSVCSLYKGTLSTGVEIAVASMAVENYKDWSNSMEEQFRKKIETLSKVSHKNFVSLIGYCKEDEPFTRMMVFEYAPNGTLFEHIHIKEAEHLDWSTRMRIAMGAAYCLEHMHQLTPPLPHTNLNSSSILLTEDYAAKISDFVLHNNENSTNSEPTLPSNIYSFGIVLLEIITGKLSYSSGSDSIDDWLSDYLRGVQNLKEMVDPILKMYREEQLERIDGLIKLCVGPDPVSRIGISEVCARLREITGIEIEGAMPKNSPLWWAELEIMSNEGT